MEPEIIGKGVTHSTGEPCGYRMSGKNVLIDMAERLRKQAERLEKLAAETGELSQDADEALWELVQCFRHR